MYTAVETALPLALARAGGFGMLPVGFDTTEQMEEKIKIIRKELDLPDSAPMPIGLGFLVCMLEDKDGVNDTRLSRGLDYNPTAVLLAFGHDIKKYVEKFRELQQMRVHKAKLVVTVNTVEEAIFSSYDLKADAMMIQGHEAGGHSRSDAPPLYTLVQAVIDAIPLADRPALIAAGAISTGAQMASLLTLGADGVVVGSRFLCTDESIYSDAKKEVIIEAGFNATVHNRILDETHPELVPFPHVYGSRYVPNDITTDYLAGESVDERFKKIVKAETNGEKNRLIVWCGAGVGHITKKEKAADVVKQLHEACVERLKNAHLEFGF